jgi:hypothetical protein
MPKLLTRLKITEVSAVDRGAGDGVKIVLMKRDDTPTPRSKPHIERHARRLRKFQEIFEGESGGDDDTEKRVDHHASTVASLLVESGRFPHRTAALDHLLNSPHGNALLARLRKAADQTEKEPNMRSSDTLESIMKDCGGPVAFAKTICDTGRSYGVTEQEYVVSAGRWESEMYGLPGDRAFAQLCEREPVVVRACGVLKTAEFAVKPQVFGREAMNPDQPTDMLAAYNEILRTIRERFPYRTGAQQLAMADEELARRYHVRPEANHANVYAMPLETRATEKHVEKRDGLRGDAYATLLAKAEQLRSERPELSVAQCFAEIYTDRANIELAKRERIESAPR